MREENLDSIHNNNLSMRKEVSKEFINEKLHNIVKCNGIIELEDHTRTTYDGVLVGSDQLWSPDAVFGNFSTLRFVPNEMNKISYATSLGVSRYPLYCRSSAKNFLRRINHLSVREKQGRKIVNCLCDSPVEVVLDPTYLLTKEEWSARIPDERLVQGRYMLCYFLGATKEHKLFAMEFAKKYRLKLVSIMSTESFSDIDVSFADEVIIGYSPSKFINLIRHAEYVFTDSFHGIAFSVINNRNFYAFYRTLPNSKNSRNSRIDNILNLWGLEDRLILNETRLEDLTVNNINYTRVNSLLENERDNSIDYLCKALQDC